MRDREIKVNIFDMAGHPFFYEVSHDTRTMPYSTVVVMAIRPGG